MRTIAIVVTVPFMLLNFGAPSRAAAEDTAADVPKGFILKTFTHNDVERKYSVYVPDIYTPDGTWPLILFLHGAGERGDDGLRPLDDGIGHAIRENPDRFPAIVLFPQCPEGRFWDALDEELDVLLDKTRAEYNIDPTRIYLTGISWGGYGTWIWGAHKTDLFAAMMPICGGGVTIDVRLATGGRELDVDYGTLETRIEKLATVPIHAFHGDADTTVPVGRTRAMVEKVREAGGEVLYTEYEGVGHNSWDRAYGDAMNIIWLLSQVKN